MKLQKTVKPTFLTHQILSQNKVLSVSVLIKKYREIQATIPVGHVPLLYDNFCSTSCRSKCSEIFECLNASNGGSTLQCSFWSSSLSSLTIRVQVCGFEQISLEYFMLCMLFMGFYVFYGLYAPEFKIHTHKVFFLIAV